MPAEPPRLMAIHDFAGFPEAAGDAAGALDAWIESLVEHGVDAVQIRTKTRELTDAALETLTRRVVRAARGRLRVLVNGRADLAVTAGADGVHLPSRGVPPAAVRRRFPELLLGLSTHHPGEIEAARDAVDYVTFSPIYATPSKAAHGPPQGLGALERAVAVGVPVLALGGIDAGRLPELAAAGARGVAAVRALQDRRSLVEMGARAAAVFRDA